MTRRKTNWLALHTAKPLPTQITTQYSCEIFQFKGFATYSSIPFNIIVFLLHFYYLYLLTLDYNFLSLKDKLVRQGNDAVGFHDNTSQKKFNLLHHHRALWKSFPSNPTGIQRHRPSSQPFTPKRITHMMTEKTGHLVSTNISSWCISLMCGAK